MSAEIEKLEDLSYACGMQEAQLLEYYVVKSTVPGICMNDGCSFVADYEPDQDAGHCDECGTQSVMSALILGGL